jgi:hypothetical protein
VITAIVDGHVVEAPARELTQVDAYLVRKHLADQGIRVVLGRDIDRVLHIWALTPTTTAQEVAALRAFAAATDARLAWHGVPVCPIHGASTPTEGCSLCGRAGREVAHG